MSHLNQNYVGLINSCLFEDSKVYKSIRNRKLKRYSISLNRVKLVDHFILIILLNGFAKGHFMSPPKLMLNFMRMGHYRVKKQGDC